MRELLRTNNQVQIGFIQALLTDAGIPVLVMDGFVSAIEGSIGAIPRRLMVGDDDLARARDVLRQAGLGHEIE